MIQKPLDDCIGFVTDHNRIVIAVMLVLTAGMLVGITNLDTASQAGGDELGDTRPAQKAEYIAEHYDDGRDEEDAAVPAAVYVRDPDGNVLSKTALLDSLRYQRAVVGDDRLAGSLTEQDGERIVGAANLVAARAAGDPEARLDEQITALEGASDEEVAELVRETFAEGASTLHLLPTDYEPGTASATGHRMLFYLEPNEDGAAPSEATRVLYEAAEERDDPEYFTLGEHAIVEANEQINQDTVELILPVALALILAVLAFSYRDLVDVVVGMTGVIVSVLWMFGIMGWLGVSAGITMIVGPVLIAGLSIDFGFHVFNRYREQRGDGEPVRLPMRRAVRAVAIALGLVTITAAIGFLSNLVNPLAVIRDLGVGITLGIGSAFVIFLTLVPALKLSIDGLLERFGLDRRKRPLGHGAYLRPLLGGGVTLAARAAPIVIVIAVVAGASGAVAWTALDEKSFQQQTEETAEWKQNLPGPLAWEDPDFIHQSQYVQDTYRSPGDDESDRAQLLIEGDVTADGTLDRVDRGVETARDRGVVFERSGVSTVVTPASVIQSVAAEDESFAQTVADADEDGDGVPDRDLEGVYDHLYEVAPEQAALVVERTDGGEGSDGSRSTVDESSTDEYRSLRAIVPVERTSDLDERANDLRAAASTIEDGSDLTATAVGESTIVQAELAALTDGILQTLVIALSVMGVALMVVYRVAQGSATLGAVTVVPIALVVGLVVVGMYLLSVPLTLLTALLMSLVVGLGVDYNIHISDRFAQEFERTPDAYGALRTAVTGTGGALLGSTLTSVGAFGSLLLHPHPQMTSFGTMVILALVTSFLVSVFVLPSLLLVWARYVTEVPGADRANEDGAAPAED
ncbi:efflux RND transporter permease subunit [Halosolutus gelatinilyticus]|uniref:efflux RND transporter permease subunit n=1 Tax=Halosolutus gelatinilyticus TaxID=2931975 RepID=UPI001FF68047|nr:MMPL family transporter [Halosolutus gelatinilyticus]